MVGSLAFHEEVTMICNQIISECQKQTEVLKRLVEQLEILNAHLDWRQNRILTGKQSLRQAGHQVRKAKSRLLSVQETSEYLGIAPSTLYNQISRGSGTPLPIRPKRIGRRVKFDRKELDAYINSL